MHILKTLIIISITFFWVFLPLEGLSQSSQNNENKQIVNPATLHLSPEEVEWLNHHQTIRIAGPRFFPPFHYYDRHKELKGISSDYLHIIVNRLGLRIKAFKDLPWQDVLQLARDGKIDLILCAAQTDDRQSYLRFSVPYLSFPMVIVTRKDAPFIGGIEDLNGKKVAVVKKTNTDEWLSRDLRTYIPYYVETPLNGLESVSYGQAEAGIENLATATYLIQEYGLTNLKIAAPAPYGHYTLHMAVRKELPELSGIIDKIIQEIPPEQHTKIRNKWLNVSYEFGIPKSELKKWISIIALLSLSVITVIFIWNRKLKRESIKLKNAEERLSLALTVSGSGVWLSNLKSREITVDDNFHKILGYQPGELPQRMEDWKRFHAEEELDAIFQKFNAHIQGKLPFYESEHRLLADNGEWRWIFTRGRVIEWDKDQQPSKYLGVVIDITDFKNTEQALRESEEKFRALVEASPLGISLIGKDGRYKYVNPRFIDIFGYTLNDIPTGKTWFEKAYPDKAYRQKVIRSWLKNMKKKEDDYPKSHIYSVACKDDNAKEIHFRAVTMDNEDHFVIYEDITEQLRMERRLLQSQKFEAIGTLAGGIAHDFNNLLMGIQGRISLISIELDDHHPQKEHIDAVEEYIKSAAYLTKQLLGFARGGKYEVRPMDINALLLESAKMFGRTKKDIRIHTKTEHPSLVVEADRGQIEQVLLNLYVNAGQAMPDGGEIHLETRRVYLDEMYCQPYQARPGNYAMVSVTDTGIGMDETVRRQIFDPFFTTKDKSRGTGLGLASAYGIIKNHAGIITVYSEIGIGTTFNIYLPLSDKPISQPVRPETEALTGTETILLVDDEEMIIDVGKALLEKLGYRVFVAQNGPQAIDLIKNKNDAIDLIILDLIMPGMDGSKAFDLIREIAPQTPVILSSGYSLNIRTEAILRKGCNGFIQKPFNMVALSKKIREVLG